MAPVTLFPQMSALEEHDIRTQHIVWFGYHTRYRITLTHIDICISEYGYNYTCVRMRLYI